MTSTDTIEQQATSTGTSGSAQKVSTLLVVTLFGIAFIQSVSFCLLFPLMPSLNMKVHGGAYGIGVLTSSYSISRLASCLLAGPLSDIIGRKPIILVALIISALAYVGLEKANRFWVLDSGRLLLGLAAGSLPVLQASLSLMVPKEEQAKYQGYFATISSVSLAVGPGIGGLLGNFLGVSGACYVPAAISLIGFVAALILFPEPAKEGMEKGAREPEKEEVTNEQTKCAMLLQCFPTALAGAFWNAHMSIFESQGALYYETILNMSPFVYGMYWTSVGAICVVCCFFAPSFLVKHLGARVANACVCIVSVLGCVMLAIVRTPWMAWIVAFTFSVSFTSQPLQAVMLTELSTSNFRGSVMGIAQACASLGRILGPLAGAAVYEAAPENIFYIAAVFAVLAAIAPFSYCSRQAEISKDEPIQKSVESEKNEDVRQEQDSVSEV